MLWRTEAGPTALGVSVASTWPYLCLRPELSILPPNTGMLAEALLVAALARLRWFAPFGMAVAQRFVMRSLVQVTRYLRGPCVRNVVQARLAEQIDERTRVLIGHSLRSVVAFEAACRLPPRVAAAAAGHARKPAGPAHGRLRPAPSAAAAVPRAGEPVGQCLHAR
jgi:hypothetical protein